MLSLLYGREDLTTPWICAFLKMTVPKDSVSIGIVKDGKIAGGALYHNYNIDHEGKPLFIEMSFGTIDKRSLNRDIIYRLLSYPFFQLRVKRVQSVVSKRNHAVRRFLEKLNFKFEGVGRQAWPHGGDACCYSLLSREFFEGKWNLNGQKRTFGSGSTRP